MDSFTVYPYGSTAAVRFAESFLKAESVAICDHFSPEVTHILLDIPSMGGSQTLRDGTEVSYLLERLSPQVHIFGGMLPEELFSQWKHTDLLTDEIYLHKNAALTAEAALRMAWSIADDSMMGAPVLVLGYGRIGKCLAKLLSQNGCAVTVAARNPRDLALAEALGYGAIPVDAIAGHLKDFRMIFNTIPAKIADVDSLYGCICLDLASVPGLTGSRVIPAQGLPGKLLPRSSGKLIADTLLRLRKEGKA